MSIIDNLTFCKKHKNIVQTSVGNEQQKKDLYPGLDALIEKKLELEEKIVLEKKIELEKKIPHFIEKYGKEVVERVLNNNLKIGDSKELILDLLYGFKWIRITQNESTYYKCRGDYKLILKFENDSLVEMIMEDKY